MVRKNWLAKYHVARDAMQEMASQEGEWVENQYGRRMKLDQLAEGTLGQKKSGWGGDAVKWWRAGEVEKVRDYCIDDVKLTKELYDYALANNKLIFKEGPQMKEIPLNTSEWEKPSDNKLTFSMPF